MFKSTDSSVAGIVFSMGMCLLSFVVVAQTKIGGTVKSGDEMGLPSLEQMWLLKEQPLELLVVEMAVTPLPYVKTMLFLFSRLSGFSQKRLPLETTAPLM